MRIAEYVCPTKFILARHKLPASPKILDIGCGNNSPSTTKQWFKDCTYHGADIAIYNNTAEDVALIDQFYLLGADGSGYEQIPDRTFDFIVLHHVVEHMQNAAPILKKVCAKLKPGGFIWIAFPSMRSLSLPSAEGTLQFCDDPTHVYVPDVREVSNVLLGSGVRVLDAGRSRYFVRAALGLVLLPLAMMKKWATGRFSGKGLWYILGFEDHVFGQRR